MESLSSCDYLLAIHFLLQALKRAPHFHLLVLLSEVCLPVIFLTQWMIFGEKLQN